MTQLNVQAAVDAAEVAYKQCWTLLALMKQGTVGPDPKAVTQFQPQLATAMARLSNLHRDVSAERARRVAAKASVSRAWFERRMRFLGAQLAVLERALLIGKSLGDGFAWFFYQNNRQFLYEHLKEPEQLLLPGGVGGKAEIELLKSVPMVRDCFLLYHGITSMLRLGDFSLIKLRPLRVESLAEVKAGLPRDGKVTITMLFPTRPPSARGRFIPAANKYDSVVVKGLTAAAKDRLRRQILRIDSAHDRIESRPDRHLDFEMDNRVQELSKFVMSATGSRVKLQRLGSSVLLMALAARQHSLYRRLADTHKFDTARLQGVPEAALSILSPKKEDNALYISAWFYRKEGKLAHRPGMTNPIWWPVDAEAVRRVLFQEVLVFTVFNPAHLFAELERAGYSVSRSWPGEFSAAKRIRTHTFELGGLGHYFELVQHYFFSEADIVGFLQLLEEQLPTQAGDGSGRIDLYIEQRFGETPTKHEASEARAES